VQQRLEGLLADDRAVVRGTERVDAYWGEMRRRLESKWEVDADLLADGPRRGLGVKIDKAWEGWRRQAATYAATGNPYGEGAWVPGSPEVADYARPLNLPEKIGPIYEGAADEGAYRNTRTALLLVVQDEAGRVVDVRVQRSSGNAAFDRLAEANARALAQYDLGLPPDGRKTVWSFDATLITTPPLPIAGCAVDAYFIPQHCFYPLSQRVTQAVRLVGVWGAGETPGLR
jgi:TonB family protein